MFLGNSCQLLYVCASRPGPVVCVGVCVCVNVWVCVLDRKGKIGSEGEIKKLCMDAFKYTSECIQSCVCVCAHSWEDPEWIKAADTPGSVLLREPAVRSGIRDQRRLSSLLSALCGVCHSKLALSQRHRSTIRLDSLEIIAVTTGGEDWTVQRKRKRRRSAVVSYFQH